MTAATSSNGNPLVSILIPCFNAERWLSQCIQSALEQTYEPKEVIVVDDGSSDGTAAIAESFGTTIRFERLKHGGANVARNRLVELSSGLWLQFLDADDYLLPDKIEKQMDAVPAEPQPDVIYSPVRYRYELRDEQTVAHIDPAADPALNFIRWGPYSTISVLIRREALIAAGGWKPGQPCCQEHELFYRLIASAARFGFVSHPGAVYRIHGPHTVSHRDPELVIRTRMELTDRMERFLKETGGGSPRHRQALFVARMESARSLYGINRDLAREYYLKAIRGGRTIVRSSPALPLTYQIASVFSSLDGAEAMAAWWRRRRGVSTEA